MLELDRHAALAQQLLSSKVRLLLVHNGAVVNAAGALRTDNELISERLRDMAPLWWHSDEPRLFALNEQQVCTLALGDHLGNTVAQLIVVHERPLDDVSWLKNLLSPLADCVAVELNLNAELDEMATELTVRYEELNLVFETQDDVQDFSLLRSYLQRLVDNCHSYMEVGLCGLILNNQQLNFSSVGASVSPSDAGVAMGKFSSSLADWVREHGQTLVVNDLEDPMAGSACAGLPYKIVAVPVIGQREVPMGVLVVAKPFSENDFTNSDRNLLEVMARKAAKIVLSSFDELTGLVGRAGFEHQLDEARRDALENGNEHALLLLNIDRMQVINDNFGTRGGDAAIQYVAETLRGAARFEDTVARLECDEFGLVLRNCPLGIAESVAQKFLEQILAKRVYTDEESFEVSASLGVVPVSIAGVLAGGRGDESQSVSALLGYGEIAQTLAKDQGGQKVCVFQSGDNEVARRQGHMQMVGNIQDALRTDKFELYAQPIVPLSTDGSMHAEILLRLRGTDDSILNPAVFLPAAERYHLMPAIDRWVFAHTLRYLDAQSVFQINPGLVITINLTGQSLSDSTFADFVGQTLDRYSFPDYSLCFEITETTAIGDLVRAQEFIANMRKRKVLFALDDFGTGLSSFAYLKELDLDYLKIDGGFVKEMCTDHVAETMVRAISDVARSMGLQTVGEFVVDLATRDKLIELGVDYGQGYALAKPAPLAELFADFSALRTKFGPALFGDAS